MHLVIVDSQTTVPTHVFVHCQSSGQGRAKNLELQGELIRSQALGEELIISRSLFVLITPTAYDIFIVKNGELNYKYNKSVALKKASEWLMYDRCAVSFDNTFVTLDSEDLTLTLLVRPNSRVFIEDVNGYEEINLDNSVEDGANFIKLRP